MLVNHFVCLKVLVVDGDGTNAFLNDVHIVCDPVALLHDVVVRFIISELCLLGKPIDQTFVAIFD